MAARPSVESVLSVFLDNYPSPSETSQSSAAPPTRKPKPCRYNQQGRCRFGAQCWNIHLMPDAPLKTPSHPPNWADAPEFHPRPLSYAAAVRPPVEGTEGQLCILHETLGECPIRDACAYVHGDRCDVCQRNALHPRDAAQREEHARQCTAAMERDMELSFAVQRSQDKCCGICMDAVLEKEGKSERRFGILEKCSHVFCLACIRKWRKSKSTPANLLHQLDPVVTRGCPECRTLSDFIVPSQYWVEEENEKAKLIRDYKAALAKKPCKFFKRGGSTCPFGNACFYLHATPDGQRVVLPPPRRRQDADGEITLMDEFVDLWDFLELRDDANRLVRYALHNAIDSDEEDDFVAYEVEPF